ncbi:MAG TPA: DNA polymerase III subunit gamma/tau [Vicinamibacterales bacterium]|nr:DNA polymerase III subunit gamma/tau [Vicinamibacterales bacterium]
MSYQVLARRWRPRRFDDVVGQPGVTRTLRNALESGRIAHAYVFAGPRGIGKTTTARILARALNCVKGPTPDPCGECDACVGIAEGRDMDVLEIDAATHTQVEKVRDTIISGLGFAPARDRYKIFVIDEVHRLSQQAFDALLKSVEEPPPHVIFMMATTELEKVPATIQSRSQVFELKPLSLKLIADRLREIAAAEGLQIDDAAVMLIARAADGSMRDALSALDQVLGFAGAAVDAESVTTVLGLVRRDLVLDIIEAVAREDAPAVFDLAGRAVEAGYDLRQVCRELARACRDLLVVSVDPSRVADPEIAQESERERLQSVARLFSYEDLMRAFDVLARAELEIKGAAQPRYHVEMALLKWIHLRRLVPLADLIAALESGGGPRVTLPPPAPRPAPPAPVPQRPSAPPTPMARVATPPDIAREGRDVQPEPARADRVSPIQGTATPERGGRRDDPPGSAAPERAAPGAPAATGAKGNFKDAFLAQIRQEKKFFYGTVVAQAHRIDVRGDEVVFAYAPNHKALRAQLDQHRAWLEGIAENVAGSRVTVTSAEAAPPAPGEAGADVEPSANGEDREAALRARAMKTEGVQALLDVFDAEIKEIEEM